MRWHGVEDNRLKLGKLFSFHFSGLRNRLLTLRTKTEVFDLESKSDEVINDVLLYWLYDVFLLWFSSQTEWRAPGYPATGSGTPSRSHSVSLSFCNIFRLLFYFHICALQKLVPSKPEQSKPSSTPPIAIKGMMPLSLSCLFLFLFF